MSGPAKSKDLEKLGKAICAGLGKGVATFEVRFDELNISAPAARIVEVLTALRDTHGSQTSSTSNPSTSLVTPAKVAGARMRTARPSRPRSGTTTTSSSSTP